MNTNERFDQLESLLVDLARQVDSLDKKLNSLDKKVDSLDKKVDSLDEKVDSLDEKVDSLDEKVDSLDEKVDKQGKLLTIVSEQVDTIVEFLKLSDARHTQAEQRQDAALVELKEQGRRLDEALNVQLQMLQLMRAGNDRTDDLTRRLSPLEGQEPRIKRLEDEVFRAAS